MEPYLSDEEPPLDQLAETFLMFFEELQSYSNTCMSHAQTTLVCSGTQDTIVMEKGYRVRGKNDEVLVHIRKNLESFPQDKERPWKNTHGHLQKSVLWHHVPVHVSVTMERKRLFVISRSSKKWFVGVPAFPLRDVADLLAFHEQIIAGVNLEPIPIECGSDGLWPVQAWIIQETKEMGPAVQASLDEWSK